MLHQPAAVSRPAPISFAELEARIVTKHGFDSKPPPGAYKFAVANLPASQSVGVAQSDNKFASSLVFFTTGVQIVCNGPALSGLRARSIAIAENQLRRL